ncbi:MAG: PTS sugar transporter subunit IIA [Longimicrobiales bacterium]
MVDLLREDLILPRLAAADGDAVIRELGEFLAERHPGVNADDAIRVLAARERLGSTAVGEGLAIPHAKLDSLNDLVACLGRSRRGIDFHAPDGKPSHFFFVLIAPVAAPGSHLKALARITRLFRDADFRARLVAARTAREMYDIITAEEEER